MGEDPLLPAEVLVRLAHPRHELRPGIGVVDDTRVGIHGPDVLQLPRRPLLRVLPALDARDRAAHAPGVKRDEVVVPPDDGLQVLSVIQERPYARASRPARVEEHGTAVVREVGGAEADDGQYHPLFFRRVLPVHGHVEAGAVVQG